MHLPISCLLSLVLFIIFITSILFSNRKIAEYRFFLMLKDNIYIYVATTYFYKSISADEAVYSQNNYITIRFNNKHSAINSNRYSAILFAFWLRQDNKAFSTMRLMLSERIMIKLFIYNQASIVDQRLFLLMRLFALLFCSFFPTDLF